MTTEPLRFHDRVHAGRLLAAALTMYANRDDVIVLALPRGGVPVAAEVARELHAPLDVMVVRKLGVPGWEELAMGAIASPGVRVMNEDVVARAGITPEQIQDVTDREMKELRRRELAFRGHEGAPDVEGKTVILIDDGIATGATIHSAIRALKAQDPAALVVAVPTTSTDARDRLAPMVDEFIALTVPEPFYAVGHWFDDFEQTTDEEVQSLLVPAEA